MNFKGLLKDTETYEKMAKAINPYGDGKASERIIDCLLYSLRNKKEKPNEFNS